MLPREILKFSFSKMHILRILSEKLTKKRMQCVQYKIDIYFSTVMDISK